MGRPCLSAESERDIKGLKKTDLDLGNSHPHPDRVDGKWVAASIAGPRHAGAKLGDGREPNHM